MPDPTTPAATTALVAWGPTSTLGVASTILGAAGAVVAAVKGNDVATAVAGGATILTAVSTIGGRMAQAVAAVRAAATVANPWIDAIQAAIAATPPTPLDAVHIQGEVGQAQPVMGGTMGPQTKGGRSR